MAARPVTHRAVYVADAPHGSERRVDANSILVDVVGDRAFLAGGREPRESEAQLVHAAVSLARDAGVELLRVYFEPGSEQTPVFLEADLWIDIAADSVASAVADRCRGWPMQPWHRARSRAQTGRRRPHDPALGPGR